MPKEFSDCVFSPATISNLISALDSLHSVGPTTGNSMSPWLQGRNASAMPILTPLPSSDNRTTISKQNARCMPHFGVGDVCNPQASHQDTSVTASDQDSEAVRYMKAFVELRHQVWALWLIGFQHPSIPLAFPCRVSLAPELTAVPTAESGAAAPARSRRGPATRARGTRSPAPPPPRQRTSIRPLTDLLSPIPLTNVVLADCPRRPSAGASRRSSGRGGAGGGRRRQGAPSSLSPAAARVAGGAPRPAVLVQGRARAVRAASNPAPPRSPHVMATGWAGSRDA